MLDANLLGMHNLPMLVVINKYGLENEKPNTNMHTIVIFALFTVLKWGSFVRFDDAVETFKCHCY